MRQQFTLIVLNAGRQEMTEAKKRKLHSAEFKAKVRLEASRSRTRATDPVAT